MKNSNFNRSQCVKCGGYGHNSDKCKWLSVEKVGTFRGLDGAYGIDRWAEKTPEEARKMIEDDIKDLINFCRTQTINPAL